MSSHDREAMCMFFISNRSTNLFTSDTLKEFDVFDPRTGHTMSVYSFARKGSGGVRNLMGKRGQLELDPDTKGKYRLTTAGLAYCKGVLKDLPKNS